MLYYIYYIYEYDWYNNIEYPSFIGYEYATSWKASDSILLWSGRLHVVCILYSNSQHQEQKNKKNFQRKPLFNFTNEYNSA